MFETYLEDTLKAWQCYNEVEYLNNDAKNHLPNRGLRTQRFRHFLPSRFRRVYRVEGFPFPFPQR